MKKKKTLALIGSGPSSLMVLSQLRDEYDVTLFEKPNKNFVLGRRILVSGNGRANFFNADLLSRPGAFEMLSFLKESLHFRYVTEGKLYYPYFNRSECLQKVLISSIEKNPNVRVVDSAVVEVDPEKKKLIYLKDGKRTSFDYDYLVFAPGGRSYDRKDYSYDLLKSLKVSYKPFESLLCPVRVRERIPSYLDKNRLRCTLTLLEDNKPVFEEKGEVLFKNDGLSGICVFDSTLTLREKEHEGKTFTYRIDYDDGTLRKDDLDSAPEFLRHYLSEKGISFPSPIYFTFEDFYPFENSQVSFGGILTSERNENLTLKKHPDIFALGEVMDNSYICGGYNMGNALLEGYLCGKELLGYAK